MTTDDYKKRFIALFKEMEDELGSCNSVVIEKCDEFRYIEVVESTYRCKMEF